MIRQTMSIDYNQKRVSLSWRLRLKHAWRRNSIPYLFILPTFAFLITFMVYPMIIGLKLSLYDWDGITAPKFIGLQNFVTIFHNTVFLIAIKNTVLFTVVTTTAKIFLGFLLAAALHFEIRGWKFFRSVFYLNVIMPMTAIGILWGVFLNPNTGPLSAILKPFGGVLPSLLGSPTLVMWVLSLIDIWKYTGFPMIFLYAAMEGIPRDLYEAAELDGISGFNKLIYVTLPLIKPVLLTITMLQTVFSFKVFDIVFTMTKGGPANASQVITFFLYKQAFTNYKFGIASAASIVLLAICMGLSYFYIRQGRIGQSEFEF